MVRFKAHPSKSSTTSNSTGRSYKIKSSVNQHLKYECGVQPQFICHICNKRFAYRKTMRKHLMLVHKTFD